MIIPAYDDDNEIHYLPDEVDESLSWLGHTLFGPVGESSVIAQLEQLSK